MRPYTVVTEALVLARAGASAPDIARRLDVPRSTVAGWIRGEVPRTAASEAPRCLACGREKHAYAGLPAAYVYLLGLYLGDGCIATHARGVFRLRIFLDAKYPGIITGCENAVKEVMPRNKIGRVVPKGGGFASSSPGSHVEVSSYSRSWPCLLPQHGPGRKHERSIVLVDWQTALVDARPELLLRGLIHSDGCRFMNTGRAWRHPRYSFRNRSTDILGLFTRACDVLGVRWTTAADTVYVSRKADVALLDRFIGPKR